MRISGKHFTSFLYFYFFSLEFLHFYFSTFFFLPIPPPPPPHQYISLASATLAPPGDSQAAVSVTRTLPTYTLQEFVFGK